MIDDASHVYLLEGQFLSKVRKADLSVEGAICLPDEMEQLELQRLHPTGDQEIKLIDHGNGTYDLSATQRDVRDVLDVLFKASHKHYSIARNVRGRVTASLHEIPFDILLQTMAHLVDATYVSDNNGIRFIKNSKPLDDEPQLAGEPQSAKEQEAPKQTAITSDRAFLYVYIDQEFYKVRKTDMKLMAHRSLVSYPLLLSPIVHE